MSPEQGPLSVAVQRPAYFLPVLALLATLALCALYGSALALWLKGLLCLALWLQLRRIGHSCPTAGQFVLRRDGSCCLIAANGSCLSGQLCGEQFVHQGLLALRLDSAGRVRHLLLRAQPEGAVNVLRQLRMRVQGSR